MLEGIFDLFPVAFRIEHFLNGMKRQYTSSLVNQNTKIPLRQVDFHFVPKFKVMVILRLLFSLQHPYIT